jgi:hypothetical protein
VLGELAFNAREGVADRLKNLSEIQRRRWRVTGSDLLQAHRDETCGNQTMVRKGVNAAQHDLRCKVHQRGRDRRCVPAW